MWDYDLFMSASNYVFLPGTLCDERIFKDLLPLFNPHFVVDLRHSDSIEDMVMKVAEVPYEKFVLIGFSMGGHVAQEFALKYPQRVERLVVIASSSEGYPADERQIVVDSLPLIEKGKFNGITDVRLKVYLHPNSYENLSIRKTIHDMAGPDAKEVYLRQIKATLDRRDLRPQMKDLKVPTFFVAGEDDKIVRVEAMQRAHDNLIGSEFLAIFDCGHFVPLERPDVLIPAIQRFIG